MRISLRKIAWLSIPLVSGLWVSRQFTNPHFASCVIDDAILQMSWVRQFSQILGDGVWMPRWLPDSNGGYGSPVFIFYSPLVYYASALIYWATDSVVLSMKLVRGIGLCLSGFTMLVFARRMASPKVALLVALVYISLPFRVLDLSYWSLFAGTWAWMWFPLILLFLNKLISPEKGSVAAMVGLAVSYAGLVLTHLVSAHMFSLILMAYLCMQMQKSTWVRTLKRSALAFSLGLGLSAFFLVPVLVERQYVHLEYNTLLPEFKFQNTFLFFPNAALMAANHFQARTLQLLRWITLLQTAMVLGSLMMVVRNRSAIKATRKEVCFWVGVVVGCLFLMSSLSAWLWGLVPGLPQIQFSTRWLSFLTLASSLVIGLGLGTFSSEASRVLKLGNFSLCFVALFFSVVIMFGGCFLGEEEEKLAAVQLYNAPEYNPKIMPNWEQRIIETRDPPFTLIQGRALVRIEQFQAHQRYLSVRAENPIRLRLRLFNYPGWKVTANGIMVSPTVDPLTGGMVVDLPAGSYELRIEFTATWWRQIAFVVSLLVTVGLFAWWALGNRSSSLNSDAVLGKAR
jgi:hypothetical protein